MVAIQMAIRVADIEFHFDLPTVFSLFRYIASTVDDRVDLDGMDLYVRRQCSSKCNAH